MSEEITVSENAVIAAENEIVIPDTLLVACNAKEMEDARERLAQFADHQALEELEEGRKLRENLEAAKKNKWRTSGLERAAKRAESRVLYYRKMAEACRAGYYMVPNLPHTVFAVRTDIKAPQAHRSGTGWWSSALPDASPKALPSGEGRYIGKELEGKRWTSQHVDEKGQKVTTHHQKATNYTRPEWPMGLVSVRLMDETQKAMALRLFDSIGIINDQRTAVARRRVVGDPMMVGIIRSPLAPAKQCSFLISWFVDTRAL
jgi:hypothetical protein